MERKRGETVGAINKENWQGKEPRGSDMDIRICPEFDPNGNLSFSHEREQEVQNVCAGVEKKNLKNKEKGP